MAGGVGSQRIARALFGCERFVGCDLHNGGVYS